MGGTYITQLSRSLVATDNENIFYFVSNRANSALTIHRIERDAASVWRSSIFFTRASDVAASNTSTCGIYNDGVGNIVFITLPPYTSTYFGYVAINVCTGAITELYNNTTVLSRGAENSYGNILNIGDGSFILNVNGGPLGGAALCAQVVVVKPTATFILDIALTSAQSGEIIEVDTDQNTKYLPVTIRGGHVPFTSLYGTGFISRNSIVKSATPQIMRNIS
jgi:hypothetical protein